MLPLNGLSGMDGVRGSLNISFLTGRIRPPVGAALMIPRKII